MTMSRLFPSLLLALAGGLLTGCEPTSDKDSGGAADDGTADDGTADDGTADDGTADDGTADGADGADGTDGGPVDADEDGATADVDCDDSDPAVNPSATEACDGIDNDCDGLIDMEDDSVTGTLTYYTDADSDGFGDESLPVTTCGAAAGLAAEAGDCDDANSAIAPDADESCNGIDDNCDTVIDGSDSVDAFTWYWDADGDGYGDPATPAVACSQPTEHVDDNTDCDDTNEAAYPGNTETWYDGADNDCSGGSDYDADLDSFDASAYGGTDCNDTDSAINTAATEIWYDGVDQDCSTTSDFDADLDGVDSDEYSGTDCNDSDAATYPGAAELWYDGFDQDCAGGDDYDADVDGFAASAYGGDDCDDTDAAIRPYALELSTDTDTLDNDCDGLVDAADTDALEVTFTDTDDGITTVSFPTLTFPFCGTSQTGVRVDTNGRLHFGLGSYDLSPSSNDMLSSATGTSAKNPMIAVLWDDMAAELTEIPEEQGAVYAVEFDDAVGIYWVNTSFWNSSDLYSPNTFSALLFIDGSFEIRHDEVYDIGGTYATDAVVGWSCGAGTTADRETDMSAAEPYTGALGLGTGRQRLMWERFGYIYSGSSGDVFRSTDPYDLEGRVLSFCPTLGTDTDGDGYTADCGDPDDADIAVIPSR
ncbi:MAG: hypothetical protein JNM72_03270 [Deltaproteobacteria bacterium]|nr:hypothetical protein [Deltaproteobacteria bacterium]